MNNFNHRKYKADNNIFIPSNTSNIACAILKVFCSEIDVRLPMSVSLCNLVMTPLKKKSGYLVNVAKIIE